MRSSKFIAVLSLILILSMVLMTGCGETKEPEETYIISETINVAAMNGPTGMGLVDLLDNANYNVEIFQAPTDAVPRRGKALGVVGPSLRVLGKQRDVSFHSENHFFLKRSI